MTIPRLTLLCVQAEQLPGLCSPKREAQTGQLLQLVWGCRQGELCWGWLCDRVPLPAQGSEMRREKLAAFIKAQPSLHAALAFPV